MILTLNQLESLKIRENSANQFTCFCPICNCDDCHYNTASRVWHCFHCRAKGAITDVGDDIVIKKVEDRILNIPELRKLYNSLANKYHDSLTSEALGYLVSRGFTDKTINKFKLGFCSSEYVDEYSSELAEDAGIISRQVPSLLNRVVIPYIVNGEVIDLRGRTVPYITYRPNTPKYLSLTGTRKSRGSVFLFNQDALKDVTSVIITEGEFKAMMADQHGFSAVATPGINGWDASWEYLFKDKDVILVADFDVKSGTSTPAYAMAKLLIKYIPHLRVASLKWVGSKDKVDVDSLLLREGGVETFKRALAGAMTAANWMFCEEKIGRGRKLKTASR